MMAGARTCPKLLKEHCAMRFRGAFGKPWLSTVS